MGVAFSKKISLETPGNLAKLGLGLSLADNKLSFVCTSPQIVGWKKKGHLKTTIDGHDNGEVLNYLRL